MDTNELLAPFERLIADICTPETIRAIEQGRPTLEIWTAFDQSGFLDALVTEHRGGAGLSLADVEPLLRALGRFAVPVPVGETMVARALLAEAGSALPNGFIFLSAAPGVLPPPCFGGSAFMLAEHQEKALLLSASGEATPLITLLLPDGGLRPVSAVLRACAIAGAADRILELTLSYAGERRQFGRQIGKQQVIQHQLAILAERAVACRLAAQIGCSAGLTPSTFTAAVAKYITSAAASEIAGIAHAVHGAIGISAEYDLQLYTRRLHDDRLADGSESYWARLLGAQRIEYARRPTVDFIRAQLDSGPTAENRSAS